MLNSATSNKLHFQNPKLKKQYSVITSFVSSGSPQQQASFSVTFYPSSIGRSTLALTKMPPLSPRGTCLSPFFLLCVCLHPSTLWKGRVQWALPSTKVVLNEYELINGMRCHSFSFKRNYCA